MEKQFRFLRPGRLVDGDLELVLTRRIPANPVKGYVPAYHFEMRHPGKKTVLGSIRLRVGSTLKLRYAGHIGYGVHKRFRGHRYAARSCRLLLPLARAHGLKAAWLTVDPRNIASQRTCEIAGAKYVDTLRLPKTNEMYAQGDRYKRRYRMALSRLGS
jgi:predicted acetyltransferase